MLLKKNNFREYYGLDLSGEILSIFPSTDLKFNGNEKLSGWIRSIRNQIPTKTIINFKFLVRYIIE